MLLNGGTLDGRRYLSAAAMKFFTTPQTGGLPTGFFQNGTYGNRGTNYGWGIATCILRAPHEGVAGMFSPGTYGHGGAWGTQAWIDPVKGVSYVLMLQARTSRATRRRPPPFPGGCGYLTPEEVTDGNAADRRTTMDGAPGSRTR